MASPVLPPSRVRPDLGERLARIAMLALIAGLVWGTVVGGVRLVAALVALIAG